MDYYIKLSVKIIYFTILLKLSNETPVFCLRKLTCWYNGQIKNLTGTMKNIYITIIMSLMAYTLMAQEQSPTEILTASIQKQITEATDLIEEVGRDKISDLYFQKLKESHVSLSQLKAEPIKNNNLVDINKMFLTIDNILNPENITLNANKLNSNRGEGNGIIRGIVRSAATGQVVTGYNVRLYDSNGNFVNSVNIDNAGRYIFTNVARGQYAIIVNAPTYNGYVFTAYPSSACPNGLGSGCQISDLTLVDLGLDEVIENTNISILSIPVISGQITDSNNGAFVRSADIKLYDSLGNFTGYGYSDDQGHYQITAPIAGDYYVSVEHSSYQLEMYEDVICNQTCDINSGDAISLSYNQYLENIDFSLQKNAIISGSIVDAVTSQALNYASIYVMDDSGLIVSSAYTSSSSYWNLSVPIGDYSIVAEKNYDDYLATKYQGQSCLSARISSCDYVSGTVIQHTTEDIDNILLTMEVGAKIKGVITDNNNQPIEGVDILVYYASDHQLVELSYLSQSDENGEFITNSLGNGDFYLVANDDSFLTQLYDSVACSSSNDCDFNFGTVVTINNLTDVNNIDFQLTGKSSIFGRVVDFNNNPINHAFVRVRDELSIDREYSYTNSNGEYWINDITPGTYQLYIKGSNDYFAESYNNIPCVDYYCEGDSFTPLVMDDTHLEIDFQLNGKGRVAVDLISNSSNPVSGGTIYVVDASGNNAGSFNSSNDITLAEGDYYFYYQSYFNQNYLHLFVPKVYGGSNCFDNCDATTGTLVHISDDSEQILTINLDEYFFINVTASPDNNAYLRIYEEDFSEHYQTNIYYQGNIKISNLGNKYLKLSRPGFYSQVYNGIDCLDSACDITQGDFITPQLNSSVTINFNLTPIASLSGVVTDENNNPVSGRAVILSSEINPPYDSLSQTTDLNGAYSFDAVPIGDYYLRVNAYDNFNSSDINATTYYGDIACDDNDCSSLVLTPITFNTNSYLENYDIQMVKRGTLSGVGIKNVFGEVIPTTVQLYKVAGETFNNIDSIYLEAGVIQPMHLPEGEYKLVGWRQNQNLRSAFPISECITDDIICISSADSLFVTNGNNTHFDSFTIHQYGVVKVVVNDAISNNPVENEKIVLYKSGQSSGQEYSHYWEDEEFRINISESGMYRAFIFDEINYQHSEYIAQLYNGIECLEGLGVDCTLSQGQEFSIENDTIFTINANLNPRPKLKVSFIDNVSNIKINSKLKVYDSNFNIVYSEYNPNLEMSHYLEYLKPGLYYALAEPRSGSSYPASGYPNSICETWDAINTCDASLVPFDLNNVNGVVKEVNIRASLLRGISGYVSDVNSGAPIGNIILDIWDSFGNYYSSATTSMNGGFSSELNSNDYYISTDTNNDYKNEIYKDIDCQNAAILGDCDVTQGHLINVPQNNSIPIVIEIELEAPDSIFANGFE